MSETILDETGADGSPDVFARIRAQLDSLAKQQRVIADFILERGLQVAFLSCNQLAHASGTSPATVVRFTRLFGYAKYVDFVDELHGLLLAGHRPMSKLAESIASDAEQHVSLERSGAHDIQSIADLAEFKQDPALAEAIELLIGARHIYVAGARSAYALAYYGGFLLREMSPNVEYFPSGAEDGFERLETAGEDDVLLIMAFRRYARSSLRLARFAAERGLRVIALTDAPTSPFRTYSDVALYGPSTAPFYSYVAPMAVLNALIWGYARAKRDEVSATLEKRQQMLLAQNVFI